MAEVVAEVVDAVPPAEVVQDAKTETTTTTSEEAPKQESVTESKDTAAPAKTESKDIAPAQTDEAPEKKEEAPEKKDEAHDKKDDSRRNGHHTGSKYRREGPGRKTDYDALPESSDHAEIRKQVEFYFSDANLARDKFLFAQLQGSKNVPVPVAVIHSFKRMRRFQPLSTVVAALQDSATLTVEDADAETPTVKRTTPFAADAADQNQDALKQQFEDAAVARTVHVAGFGDEKPTTQFDIEAFFAPYGTTNQVRLRRWTDGTFKGSVSVEFDAEEAAADFLKADPAPTFQGRALDRQSQRAFLRAKNEESRRYHRHRRGSGDDGDWRVRRDEDRKRGGGGFHKGGRDRDGGGRGGRYDRRDRHRDDRDRDRDHHRKRDRSRDRSRDRDRNRERRERDEKDSGSDDDKKKEKPAEAQAQAETDKKEPEAQAQAETDTKKEEAAEAHNNNDNDTANDKKRPREEDDEPNGAEGQQQPPKRARSRSNSAGG